ncbi:hypothetical protein BC833DRAFT_136747 [Globomyces pollinis-pini]|nr:hypothetical protein BC833DRAFT_136747 [Globomyces pollinis-pini]
MSLPASSDRTAVPDTSFSASILSEFNLDKPQTPVRASNSTPVRPGSAPPRTIYPPRQSYGLDTNPTSKSSSNRSESSGPIFFFSDVAIDDSFLNYVTSLYLPIKSNIKATENHIAYVNSEVTVTKGDILTVLEHTLDGWCYGRNVTKQSDGKFPVYCVTPKHTTLLNYINCYRTPKSFIIPEKIEYVENVFPGLIKFHYLDLNNIVESSLYPIFGTLNGDEKCLIHGSMEMTQFMTGFLKEFGESFWKDLDIETV